MGELKGAVGIRVGLLEISLQGVYHHGVGKLGG